MENIKKEFKELWHQQLEYWYTDISMGYLQENTLYHYVSSSLLDGFINYVVIVDAYVSERYTDFNEDSFLAAQQQRHTEIGYFGNDVLILAESNLCPEIKWFFWYSCDCSDCSIGIFRWKEDNDKLKEMFAEYIDGIEGSENKFQIPPTSFKGWVKW